MNKSKEQYKVQAIENQKKQEEYKGGKNTSDQAKRTSGFL